MRVTTQSAKDFIANIEKLLPADEATIVHYERTNKRDGHIIQYFYGASAVVPYLDGQALLVLGVDCGIDVESADPDTTGSDTQAKLHGDLSRYCENRKLAMLPGALDI